MSWNDIITFVDLDMFSTSSFAKFYSSTECFDKIKHVKISLDVEMNSFEI